MNKHRRIKPTDQWLLGDSGSIIGVQPSGLSEQTIFADIQETLSNKTLVDANLTGQTVVDSGDGAGILVDTSSPTYCYRDIIGSVAPKASGVGSPTRRVYDGANVADYAFALNDLCEFCWHIPHDWVVGTPLQWHVHFSHNDAVSITGNVVFTLYYRIGKRGGQFTPEKTLTLTYNTVNLATTPKTKHMVVETDMSSDSGSATLIANSDIEVDSVIIATMKMTTLPTFGGGGYLFVHTSDIHYQSSNIGTKNSAYPFYG